MKKPAVLIGIAVGAVVLALVVYSSFGLRQYRVEVCVEFNGQQNCRTASAATRKQAQRAATDNACAPLTRGMTETMACSSREPVRVTWLDSAN